MLELRQAEAPANNAFIMSCVTNLQIRYKNYKIKVIPLIL